MVWWKMCNFLHIVDHNSPVNWLPRSVSMVMGTPYLETQVLRKLDTMLEAVASSSHLVFLSIMVSR